MNKEIIEKLKNKEIVILGFGREGQSTYRYLRQLFPEKPLAIADIDNSLPAMHPALQKVEWITGSNYQKEIEKFDIIIKSPGISLPGNFEGAVTSQADLFLRTFGDQIIGVTGTKGKSTTSSLIYHLIKQQTSNAIFVGNIGTPPFEKIDKINKNTLIVNEISAHQLENTSSSPATAVFLNLYEEHLDRFQDKASYYKSKLNILRNQTARQQAILNDEESMRGDLDTNIPYPGKKWLFGFEEKPERHAWIEGDKLIVRRSKNNEKYSIKDIKLKGRHNLLNVMAAVIACRINHINYDHVARGIHTFPGLEHRLEEIGTYHDITFYNDSISTIPQTTIEALKTLPHTDTLILGGYDREIDYKILYDFLSSRGIRNLIFTGPAGERMRKEFNPKNQRQRIFVESTMRNIVERAFEVTHPGKTCLLSPAASSYDQFKNFEERGTSFKEWIKKTGTLD